MRNNGLGFRSPGKTLISQMLRASASASLVNTPEKAPLNSACVRIRWSVKRSTLSLAGAKASPPMSTRLPFAQAHNFIRQQCRV